MENEQRVINSDEVNDSNEIDRKVAENGIEINFKIKASVKKFYFLDFLKHCEKILELVVILLLLIVILSKKEISEPIIDIMKSIIEKLM